MDNLPILLTINDVAKIMNLSRSTVYQLMNKGELKSCNIGRSRRITGTQVEDYINSLNK